MVAAGRLCARPASRTCALGSFAPRFLRRSLELTEPTTRCHYEATRGDTYYPQPSPASKRNNHFESRFITRGGSRRFSSLRPRSARAPSPRSPAGPADSRCRGGRSGRREKLARSVFTRTPLGWHGGELPGGGPWLPGEVTVTAGQKSSWTARRLALLTTQLSPVHTTEQTPSLFSRWPSVPYRRFIRGFTVDQH